MGWSEARVSLLPPGWKSIIEACQSARTTSGSPLRIVSAERISGNNEPALPERPFREWLKKEGFTEVQETAVMTVFRRREIDVDLSTDDGVVSEVMLEFKLNAQSVSRIGEWDNLVVRLNHDWQLRLVDVQLGTTVGPEEFRRLLANATSWREFSERYNWPAISQGSENPGPQSSTGIDAIRAALTNDDGNSAAAMLDRPPQNAME